MNVMSIPPLGVEARSDTGGHLEEAHYLLPATCDGDSHPPPHRRAQTHDMHTHSALQLIGYNQHNDNKPDRADCVLRRKGKRGGGSQCYTPI